MPSPGVHLERRWPVDRHTEEWIATPRDGVVREVALATAPGDHRSGARPLATFGQADGPFRHYHRTVHREDGALVERVSYRLVVPWFAWLFGPLVRRWMRRQRPGAPSALPWWSPPDRLDARQVTMLGLLAAASLSSAFVNTLFTQTVAFAGDDFGVGDWGRGVGGTVVRLGIVLAIPLALAADRVGRRRLMVATAWAAPVVSSLGALAPSFPVLVATQTVGRPLGLALDLLVAVVATEEMPRSTRAYAVSILALASGLGASVAVLSLPLADLGAGAWRSSYLLALVWLPVAVSLTRHLPETSRFEVHREEIEQHTAPPLRRSRLAVQCAVAFFGNLIVAPASFFQNAYLKDVRGYSGLLVTLFTLGTGVPGAIGLMIGGRIADRRGRRWVAVTCVPGGALLITLSFGVAGAPMWAAAMIGGLLGAAAFPALAVYRAELFPTGRRSVAGSLILAAALVGGSIGLLLSGSLLDAGWSHRDVMGYLLVGPAIVAVIVWLTYPETAHRELEDINPEDRFPAAPGAA